MGKFTLFAWLYNTGQHRFGACILSRTWWIRNPILPICQVANSARVIHTRWDTGDRLSQALHFKNTWNYRATCCIVTSDFVFPSSPSLPKGVSAFNGFHSSSTDNLLHFVISEMHSHLCWRQRVCYNVCACVCVTVWTEARTCWVLSV